MGVSLSKVNRLLASGRIAAKKDGRTVLISAASLAHYLDNLPPATFRTSADRAA
jgi:excisionase family DNA binding protein